MTKEEWPEHVCVGHSSGWSLLGTLAFDNLKITVQSKFTDRDHLEITDFKLLPGVLFLKEDILNCGVA